MPQTANPFSSSLAQRRQALVAQARVQRSELAAHAQALQARLSLADAVFSLAARLRRKPLLTGAVVAALGAVIVRPRTAIRWIGYTATLISLLGRLRALFAR